jgi:hypothetical protein
MNAPPSADRLRRAAQALRDGADGLETSVALALADWLDVEARREAHSLAEFGYRVVANEATTLARTILREEPPA